MSERPYMIVISLFKRCFCQSKIRLCFIIFFIGNIRSVNEFSLLGTFVLISTIAISFLFFFFFFLFAYHVHSHSLIMQWVYCDDDLRFSKKWSKPETKWKRKQMKEIFTNSGLNVSIKIKLAPVDFTWFYFLLYLKLLSPYMKNF